MFIADLLLGIDGIPVTEESRKICALLGAL